PLACALRLSLLENVFRRSKVFDGKPQRLEQSYLVRQGSARLFFKKHLAQFGANVFGADCSFLQRNEVIARFVNGGLAAVNEEARGGDCRSVNLARCWR